MTSQSRWVLLLGFTFVAMGCSTTGKSSPEANRSLQSVAIRVHDLDAMVGFYQEAFGFQFESTMTGPIQSQFGTLEGFTLKLVPLRESADFDNYPSHQLGFEVDDIDRVIQIAEKHGGRTEDIAGDQHAAIRDPDGNTIELYSGREE